MSENEDKKSNAKLSIISLVVVGFIVAAAAVYFLSGNSTTAIGQTSDKNAAATASGEAPMIKLGNPIVAVVNGKEINRSDVFNFISGLPEQVRQMPIQDLFPLAQQQLINNKVITDKADNAKLDTDPEVERRVNQAKSQIVRNIYIERQVEEMITQRKILAEYESLLTQLEDVKETKAAHILVKEEAEAKEVVKMLDEGAEFATVAKEKSIGPSAERGGDLGYFAKGEMVPEFADAAFSLDPGAYTKDAVKTQFGWHIIKVEDRRKRPEPAFETVKPQLEQQLRQKVLVELLENWKKSADIKLFDINGEKSK